MPQKRQQNLIESTQSSTSLTSEETWATIKKDLNNEFGNAIYNSWIKHLDCFALQKDEVTLSAPSRFIKEWNRTHYAKNILAHWQRRNAGVKRVEFITRKSENNTGALTGALIEVANTNQPSNSAYGTAHAQPANNQAQAMLSSTLDKRFTFDNFITGASNSLAATAAKAIAGYEKPQPGSNPFFIHSDVGLGKTHLMHAIAAHVRETWPQKRVVYLSAEKFMFEFIRALRNKGIMEFKEALRSVDMLLIDDIQFIAGKESTQEEFCHTLNAILADNKQLVIAGDRPPSELEGFSDRTRSRLGGGLVVDIKQPDYALRSEILRSKKAQCASEHISDDVAEFLATHVTSNIRELEGAFNKVMAHASLFNKEVTVNNVRTIVSDLLRSNDRTLTIHEIQKKVASYFDIKITDMTSARRMRSIARPRQVAMYLAKQLTTRSLSEIGRKFGGKDHTTVMHGIKRIGELIKSDPEVCEDVEKITKML